MNILITGANGQLGKEFKRVIEELGNGHPDHTTGEKNYYIFADHKTLDITDREKVNDFIIENYINIVINCAAYTNVNWAEKDINECMLINSEGPLNLYNACNLCGAKLINFSSDYVFDNSYTSPIDRYASTNPLGVYGKSKVLGEEIIPNALTFRVSGLYSDLTDNNFPSKIIHNLMNNYSFSVVNDQICSPTYTRTLAKYIIHIIEDFNHENGYLLKKGVYHFCDSNIMSWYEFAKFIEKCYRKNTEYTSLIHPCLSSEFPSPVERPKYSVLDCTETWETFGFPDYGYSFETFLDLKLKTIV